MSDWRPIEAYNEQRVDRLSDDKPVEIYGLTSKGEVYSGPAVRYGMQWQALEKRRWGRPPRRIWPTHWKPLHESPEDA